MACSDTITDCVSDPLQTNNLGAANSFATLSSSAIFSINLVLYFTYVALLAWSVWFLVKGIVAITNADSSESFEKFREALTNAVFAAVGIILLFSARFILASALSLIGIEGAENVFGVGFDAIF